MQQEQRGSLEVTWSYQEDDISALESSQQKDIQALGNLCTTVLCFSF